MTKWLDFELTNTINSKWFQTKHNKKVVLYRFFIATELSTLEAP